MKHVALAVVLLAACKNDRADKAQEQFDRAIERSGGIERDKDGRAYRAVSGDYVDQRGGKVDPSAREPGVLPPETPETDVTRGQIEEYANNDRVKARALYEKACKEKIAGGCAHAVLLDRTDKPEDAAKQAKALCDGGDAAGCFAQAMIFETAVLEAKHEASEVVALYDKGCTGGYAESCNALGMVYHSGRGGAPKDKKKAAEALQKGCDLGDRQSCMQVPMVMR